MLIFSFPIVNNFIKNDITRFDENTFINLDFVNPIGKNSKLELVTIYKIIQRMG